MSVLKEVLEHAWGNLGFHLGWKSREMWGLYLSLVLKNYYRKLWWGKVKK